MRGLLALPCEACLPLIPPASALQVGPGHLWLQVSSAADFMPHGVQLCGPAALHAAGALPKQAQRHFAKAVEGPGGRRPVHGKSCSDKGQALGRTCLLSLLSLAVQPPSSSSARCLQALNIALNNLSLVLITLSLNQVIRCGLKVIGPTLPAHLTASQAGSTEAAGGLPRAAYPQHAQQPASSPLAFCA